ncbi:hypothetical protein B7463_g6595, partial [Scytalidium lignicola]
METVKNAANYVSESVKGGSATASKEVNKNVAKDGDASIGTRATAAKDAASDKVDEFSHNGKADAYKDPLTATSLASSVIQFVSFAHEVCSLIKEYSGNTAAPKEILEQILLVDYKLEALSQIIASNSDRRLSKEEEAVVEQCIKHAQELKTYLIKFKLEECKTSSKKSRWLSRRSFQKTTLAVRVKWGKETLSNFQKRVDQLFDVIQLQGQSRTELSVARAENNTNILRQQLDQMITAQNQISKESADRKKIWCEVFFEDRGFKEDGPFIEFKVSLDEVDDDIGLLLQDIEEEVHSPMIKAVEDFCRDARMVDLKSGRGVAGQRRGAWIDDRCFTHLTRSGYVRKYQNPLSATTLYQLLQIPRFNNGDMPDANRRLIYIENLDPYYILALGYSASFHQISALREAIWTHISFQASMRIKVPATGFTIFQLEFHIPYFVLKTSPSNATMHSNPRRGSRDISSLETNRDTSQEPKNNRLYEAQISFVICGSDNRCWVGYAFADTYFGHNDLKECTFSYDGLHEDPIASDGELDLNLPIWDPREYFLIIVKIRMAQVLKEWELVINTVGNYINTYTNQNKNMLSLDHERLRDGILNAKDILYWTQQAADLLSNLSKVLSETIKVWEEFNSSDGDICYFNNLQPRAQQLIGAIKQTFDTLKSLQNRLHLLEKSCKLSKTLPLRLALVEQCTKVDGLTVQKDEIHKEPVQHHGVITVFTISIFTLAMIIGFLV